MQTAPRESPQLAVGIVHRWTWLKYASSLAWKVSQWPGDNFWRSAFAYQDRLIPFELLAVHQGKLVFLEEN